MKLLCARNDFSVRNIRTNDNDKAMRKIVQFSTEKISYLEMTWYRVLYKMKIKEEEEEKKEEDAI